MLYILIGSAMFFDFLNGFHDSSNLVATVIASRAMSPRWTLALTAVAEFSGPFLFGVAVAKTVGEGLIDSHAISLTVILAGLWAAILWNLVTWYVGIPSSSSHALIGGLVGAAVLSSGWDAVQLQGLLKILLALFLSPVLGLLVGYLFTKLVLFLARAASPKINEYFKRAQIVTLIGLALSHGTNDAQKTMGVVTLALVVSGWLDSFQVPIWVILISAVAISFGIASGGWRLIRTLGGRIYKIRPVHGFTSQVASASVILGAAFLGGPVSTTQVVSSAIMGAGAAERITKVRWQVAQEMLWAWGLTIPLTSLTGGLIYLAIKSLIP